jgi:hypothetical protein
VAATQDNQDMPKRHILVFFFFKNSLALEHRRELFNGSFYGKLIRLKIFYN